MKAMSLPSNVLSLIGLLFPLTDSKKSVSVPNLYCKRIAGTETELVKISKGSTPDALQLEFLRHGAENKGRSIALLTRRSKLIDSIEFQSPQSFFEMDLKYLNRGIYELMIVDQDGSNDHFELIKL